MSKRFRLAIRVFKARRGGHGSSASSKSDTSASSESTD